MAYVHRAVKIVRWTRHCANINYVIGLLVFGLVLRVALQRTISDHSLVALVKRGDLSAGQCWCIDDIAAAVLHDVLIELHTVSHVHSATVDHNKRRRDSATVLASSACMRCRCIIV